MAGNGDPRLTFRVIELGCAKTHGRIKRKALGTTGGLFRGGGAVVCEGELLRIARRYDTQPARAMLRALGYEPLPWHRAKRRRRKGGRPRDRRYDGMLECFRNHGSPMDARR